MGNAPVSCGTGTGCLEYKDFAFIVIIITLLVVIISGRVADCRVTGEKERGGQHCDNGYKRKFAPRFAFNHKIPLKQHSI
jgi:hypothetical protein